MDDGAWDAGTRRAAHRLARGARGGRDGGADEHALRAQTDGTCVPVAERAGRDFGCFITAREELGPLAATPALYWYLDTYPRAPRPRLRRGPSVGAGVR
jgi:hypothetical protein